MSFSIARKDGKTNVIAAGGEDNEVDIFLPNSEQTIDQGTNFENNDLLLITSKNLPNDVYSDTLKEPLKLVYGGKEKGIIWEEDKNIENRNAELMNNDTLLSFLTVSESNVNGLYLIQGPNIEVDYKQTYINLNKSILIKANQDDNSFGDSVIGSIITISLFETNNPIINDASQLICNKMNKYYYNLNKNIFNKHIKLIKKEEGDKEYNLEGGNGRKSTIIISNNLDLFDDKIHIKLNENIYIKGIFNGGYLYKENDILKINNELFQNINFKVTNVNKTDLNKKINNEKTIYTKIEKSITSKNIKYYSSFNITMNCIKYSTINIKKQTTPVIKYVIQQTDYDKILSGKNLKENNILFKKLIYNNYNYDDDDDNKIYKDYLIIKNVHITGIINKNSFYIIKIFTMNIEKNVNDDQPNFSGDDNTDLKLEKEFFYNNQTNNGIAINENYDLNLSINNNYDLNLNNKFLLQYKLIIALITSIK